MGRTKGLGEKSGRLSEFWRTVINSEKVRDRLPEVRRKESVQRTQRRNGEKTN